MRNSINPSQKKDVRAKTTGFHPQPNRKALLALSLLLLAAVLLLFVSWVGPRQILYKIQNEGPEFFDQAVRGLSFSLKPKSRIPMDPNITSEPLSVERLTQTAGPLRVNPDNPRYFMDRNGKTILLTGSHTWLNFQDIGGSDPPPAFDDEAYLDFLVDHHHNFFRLWVWESPRWALQTEDDIYWFSPMPYERTGPGLALDGKEKFDLTQFNQAYFDRLRTRIQQAGERGIYVSIMLYNGWSSEREKGSFSIRNPWKSHPYNFANNINGVNGDANANDSGDDLYLLNDPEIIAYQEAYLKKVIDTVNDLDNVLYEISNESHSGSQDWQYHIINYIHQYEAKKPRQHPVGMTVEYPLGDNAELLNSPAEWISPNADFFNPSPTEGQKVILFDTDHLCGICGDRQWAWKSFTRGYNPIFMDGYDGAGYGVGAAGYDKNDPKWELLRKNLGYILFYSEKVDLAQMEPRTELCSTGYCLANLQDQRTEILVYLPEGNSVTVDLTTVQEELLVEWLDPLTGEVMPGHEMSGGINATFNSPFNEDAVLLLSSHSDLPPSPAPAPFRQFFLPVLADSQVPTETPSCWPDVTPVGALPGQPKTVFCDVKNGGADTSQEADNAWIDTFDQPANFADFAGTHYKLFETVGFVYKTIHWRHNDHWMVDLASRFPQYPSGWNRGGSLMRPDRTFHFQSGKLVVEADVAAGMEGYGGNAWPEIVITTGAQPVDVGSLYAYEMFPEDWTLGCRLQDSRYPVCALKRNDGDVEDVRVSTRAWEMSAHQLVGTDNFGGAPFEGRENYWRLCGNEDPDDACRDRFRLELTKTSLTLYVNGRRYFQQRGIPPLPNEMLSGEVYVYFASIVSSHSATAIRFHWDQLSVNPDLLTSATNQ